MSGIWDEATGVLSDVSASEGWSLTSGDAAAINGLIEEAMADPDREALRRASEALEGAFRRILAMADPSVRGVVHGDAAPEIRAAYLLGQVGMAQGICAHAFGVRADAGFGADLGSGDAGAVARALLDGERDVPEIVSASGLDRERVVAALVSMVRSGSVDYRQPGESLRYFLTPPARAVLA